MLLSTPAYPQGGRLGADPWVASRTGNPVGGALVSICQPLATTAASITSNLAVFTMTSNPITAGFVQGMTVQVAGFTAGDAYLNSGTLANGTITNGLTILSVSSTTVVAYFIHANASAATNGTLLQMGNSATSCAGLSTLYTDVSLVTTTPNPLIADGLGNYGAGAAPGTYYAQVYGSGITTTLRQIIVPCAVGSSCAGSSGPTLQTNGVSNASQSLLNLKNGTNITITSDGAGGVTINSPLNSGLLVTDNIFTNNNRFKGIDPWADITAFGAVATLPNGWIQDTASCNGTTTITMAHTFFQNGQGLTITGCGPTETMGTITIVTGPRPILAISGTSPYQTSINGNAFPALAPTGASTYKFAIVGRDIFGGLTAASAPVTIANSPATIGLTTLSMATESLSGSTITVTTTGTQALAVGAEVHLSSSTNALLSGWFNVATVNNAGNTFTVTPTGVDTRILGAQSSTGGSVSYYTGMYVDWTQAGGTASSAYYICAQRPGDGAMHVIGETAPSLQDGSIYPDASFYDFGATLMGNPTLPFYVTDAVCTSVTQRNDPLTTTIVSGGGTTSVVVANSASQTIAGQEADFDDAPAILAAANSCSYNSPGVTGCSIYIPAVPASGGRLGYVVNSYLKLPSGTSIKQSGQLYLYETLELQGVYNWEGEWEAAPGGSFAMQASANVSVQKANPGIFTRNSNSAFIRNLSVSSSGTNGGVLWVTDDPYNQTFSHVNFDTNQDGAGDYCGHGMLVRSTSGGGNPIHFDHVSFGGGPNQVTDSSWCPLLYFPGINTNAGGPGATGANWFVDIGSIFINRRGIQQDTYGGPGSRWKVDWMYRQGGITPLFTFMNGTGSVNQYLNIGFAEQDTETSSTVAFLGGSTGSWLPFLNFTHVFNGSSEAGGVPPTLTGLPPSVIDNFEGGFNSLNKNTIATDQLGFHANLIQRYAETFALLPSCSGNEGMTAEITDSTTAIIGATVTGGGSNKIVARCDGTNWTVFGGGTLAVPGPIGGTTPAAGTFTTLLTATNCKGNGTAANPSVVTCSAAAAGMFSCDPAASTGTCQVNTTAVTANSEIQIIQDAADGGASQLNVTCNTALVTPSAKPILLSKNTGVSFTINLGTVAANPGCFEYTITN
jgi:hypothetical protein